MYDEFVQKRILNLRLRKDVSAQNMSISLGQNKTYINQIENGKALPSLQGLFYICDYFGITPQEFFDDGNPYPSDLNEVIGNLKKLDSDSLMHLNEVVKDMVRGK